MLVVLWSLVRLSMGLQLASNRVAAAAAADLTLQRDLVIMLPIERRALNVEYSRRGLRDTIHELEPPHFPILQYPQALVDGLQATRHDPKLQNSKHRRQL